MSTESVGEYRVIVRSLGSAHPRVRRALVSGLGLHETVAAKALFQAPSVVASGLPRSTAEQACELLRGSGLAADVLPADEAFSPGYGDREIALFVRDVGRLPEIVALVAALLEIPTKAALERLFRSPAVLLGNVSEPSASALRERFAALGAELDVSRPDDALYDVFVERAESAVRGMIERSLRAAGADVASMEAGATAAFGLTRAQADEVWQALSRTGAPMRIVNRDFQRFDVTLVSGAPGAPGAGIEELLVSSTGMPRGVAKKALARLPVLVHAAVPYAAAQAFLRDAERVGARAEAGSLANRRFSIEVSTIADPQALLRFLQERLSMAAEEAKTKLARLPSTLPGPFTEVQARWLVHELKGLGVAARRVSR